MEPWYTIFCCKNLWDLDKMAPVLTLCTYVIFFITAPTTTWALDDKAIARTHLACHCEHGYYKQSNVILHAPKDICGNESKKSSVTSLEMSLSLALLHGQPANDLLHPVSLSVCGSCSQGCLTCSGPNKKDCIACKSEYFLLLDSNADNEGLSHNVEKRSSYGNKDQLAACVDGGNGSSSNTTTSCNRDNNDIEGLQSLRRNESQKAGKINKDPELGAVLSQEELLSPNLITTFDDASGESPEEIVKLNSTFNSSDGNNNGNESKNATVNCVARCPVGMFADDMEKTCKTCHPECDGCEGTAPDDCLRCKNLLHVNICVHMCPEGYTVTEPNVCQKESQVVSGVPSPVYIILPLVAMVLIGTCGFVVIRRYRCGKCPRLARVFNGRESPSCQNGHSGHQKCYLKKGRLPEFLTLKPYQSDQPKMGNINVYIDRPLPQKGNETVGSYQYESDLDDDDDDDGPLYETPGRGSPASYQERRAYTDGKHYLTPCSIGTLDSRKNYNMGSGCSCKSLESVRSCGIDKSNVVNALSNMHIIHPEEEEEENPDLLDGNIGTIKSCVSEGIHWEICNELKQMEVPYFNAPPLPERNSSVSKSSPDPIYSNIDEDIL